jgi:hypothetical protein
MALARVSFPQRESADECDSGDELKMPPNKHPSIRAVS